MHLSIKWVHRIEAITGVLYAKLSAENFPISSSTSTILQSFPTQITESHRGLCKSAMNSDVTFLSLLFQTVFCQWSTSMNSCLLRQRNNRHTAKLSSTAISSSRGRSFLVLDVRVSSVIRTTFIIIRNSSAVNRHGLIVPTAFTVRSMYRMYAHTYAGSTLAIKYMPSTCAK